MSNARLVKWLVACNLLLLVSFVALLLHGMTGRPAAVLSVERLNIVDSAGHPVLVLANGPRLPGATFARKEYPPSFVDRGQSAGMIFFNQGGDEVGGLIYEGAQKGSAHSSFGHLSFDQWKQNQVVAIQYQDDGESRSAGMRVWDRPADAPLEEQFILAERMLATPPGPARDALERERLRVRLKVAGTPRLFVGSQNQVAKIELRDGEGHVRVRLAVDAAGAAHLEFLDALGQTTAIYP